MIKRLEQVEIIVLGYVAYFTITLFFAPKLFQNEQTNLYDALLLLMENQNTWEIIGTLITVMYLFLFFYRHHLYAMIVNAVGGAFMMLICVTYLFTYPNIGSGIFLFVSFGCFAQIYSISNAHENRKAEKLKTDHKIINK